jgi:hypothetical protein
MQMVGARIVDILGAVLSVYKIISNNGRYLCEYCASFGKRARTRYKCNICHIALCAIGFHGNQTNCFFVVSFVRDDTNNVYSKV